jgi:hypothetical protein
MTIAQWSTTAANNATGVTNVNWAEGQAPSTVNDSSRQVMADVAAWVGQASGAIPEYLTGVAGTNTITATGPAQMASYVAGQRFHFIPAATNTGAATLNITPSGGAALGAKNIFSRGAALTDRELVINVPAVVVYDGTQFNMGTSGAVAVTPAKQQFHPSAAKAWGKADTTGGLSAGYNVSSITDVGTGKVTFNWTTSFSSANYGVVIGAQNGESTTVQGISTFIDNDTPPTAAAATLFQYRSSGAAAVALDPNYWYCAAYGDQ